MSKLIIKSFILFYLFMNLFVLLAEAPDISKIAIYWRGDAIYNQSTIAARDNATQDIIDRGFTHVLVLDYMSNRDAAIDYFYSKGLKVILEVTHNNHYSLKKANEVDPFSGTDYINRYNSLKSIVDSKKSKLDGIVDDFEIYSFNKISFWDNGGERFDQTIIYPNTRITNGYVSSAIEDRQSFKNRYPRWNTLSLDVDKIQFNNPALSIEQSSYDTGFLLGWYGPYWNGSEWVGDASGDYYQVIQTFKPNHSRISQIDIKIMRQDNSNGICPGRNVSKHFKDIVYYIVTTDASGNPQLNNVVGEFKRYIKCENINYSGGSSDNFSGIDYISLYFDPDMLGSINTSNKYALVIEYNTSDYSSLPSFDSINWSHYRVATKSGNPYPNGKIFKGRLGNTPMPYDNLDLTFKVYYPSSSYNGIYNQLHRDWIEFQCENMKLIAKDYKNMITYLNLYLYSGYQTQKYYEEYPDERYSADWEKLIYPADYAICGYTNTTSYITYMNSLTSTNSRFIGGVIDQMGSFSTVYNTSDDGVMYAHWSFDAGYIVPGSISPPLRKADELNENKLTLSMDNYPNPFNPTTKISYQIPEQGFVTLKVYDMLGREVASLVDNKMEAGKYSVNFNAGNLASGIYVYRITVQSFEGSNNIFTQSNKMLLLK